MPAYNELDVEHSGDGFEIRTHSVVRQDQSKISYDWPKLRISSQTVDVANMLAEWYEVVGGSSNGSLTELLQNGLNHAISVAKDPSRVSADPAIKQFKANFRKAMGEGDAEVLASLKSQDADLYGELSDAAVAKIQAQNAALA